MQTLSELRQNHAKLIDDGVILSRSERSERSERPKRTHREIKAQIVPDPDFQGWWQAINKPTPQYNGGGLRTQDAFQYIFLDTTSEPDLVILSTLAGTLRFPRELTPLDGQTFNTVFEAVTPTELIPPGVADIQSFFNGPSFTLQDAVTGESRKMLINNVGPYFNLWNDIANVAALYEKIDEPPVPIRPYSSLADATFPDVNDPVNIARYYLDSWIFSQMEPQNVHYNDRDYRPYAVRKQIEDALFGPDGITIEVPIRRVRVSRPGEHIFIAAGPTPSFDIATDIFTDGYSYATAGSTVEVCGFKGNYSALNGKYVNGVAIIENGAVPNARREHLDVSVERSQKDTLLPALSKVEKKCCCHKKKCRKCCRKRTSEEIAHDGTWVNVFDHFLLRADTVDASRFPRDASGWAQFRGCPTVKVNHRFRSDMSYSEFIAALYAMFYMMYQVSQHFFIRAYAPLNSIFMFTEWEDVRLAVADPSRPFFFQPIRSRTEQVKPSINYNNPTFNLPQSFTYNDPFGLVQTDPYLNYSIDLGNYVVNPQTAYWAIEGTLNDPPIFPIQGDPTTIGFLPVIPAPGRARFVSALSPLSVVDGVGTSVNPNPDFYTILNVAVFPGSVLTPDENAFFSTISYLGQIDPSLTNGKTVGYYRFGDVLQYGGLGYSISGFYSPAIFDGTLYYNVGGEINIFATIMRYFVTTMEAQSIIIDLRGNLGGFFSSIWVLMFFVGALRKSHSSKYAAIRDTGYSDLIDLTDPSVKCFDDAIRRFNQEFETIPVDLMESIYGAEAIFRGTSDQDRRKIIVLVDEAAASGGDGVQWFLLGEKLDGDLGAFTSSILIGDNDGRLKGYGSRDGAPPVSPTNNFLVDANGNPVAPTRNRTDAPNNPPQNIATGLFFNEQNDLVAPSSAPSLQGTSGSEALPNDWDTNFWPDVGLVGFTNHSGLPLPNPVYEDRTTWRDTWLEQAILAAIAP